MLINEVCNLTGLTKKAISYYEKQGLLKPKKSNNGYREYSEEDIALLNEISLYRKLDIAIKDIKVIVKSKDKKYIINNIIKDKQNKEIQIRMQKRCLEKIIENNFEKITIKELNDEIIEIEKNNGEFIKRELIRSFPGGLGKYLAYHFAPYLNESLDTPDKYEAWINIVEFLDNVPEIKIPRFIQIGYENINDEMAKKISAGTRNEINNMLNAEGEELEKYKQKLLDNIEKQNDKSLLKVMNPFYKFKKQLNEFFNSSGYYDIFLPNMKILSSEYKEYHDKLIKLNDKLSKELGIKYDENMRIIISRDNE
ncbi:MerR family transcriptional regulator [Clostridium celatum]|uniref:Transcriptional regulator, MerR family n=1 Tax=Clostridium celatum DSM 1785 TaxID=545697 RepID=L1QFM1_9CLOT|nr:MerR family transcriptional regulator [Clostridium celatum]EKY26377.1 transcriptional regulator, MerR family [Clostridium celatum DSM 1785]MCE9655827.1 MerR family transcriptional regulator [Clostridium celatum]